MLLGQVQNMNRRQNVFTVAKQKQIIIVPGRLEQIVENVLLLTVGQATAHHVRSKLLLVGLSKFDYGLLGRQVFFVVRMWFASSKVLFGEWQIRVFL